MRTLHQGFAGQPARRYFPARDQARTAIDTQALPGAVVHVLGPSRDRDAIRDMDPPAGQAYMKLVDSPDGDGGPAPFRTEWQVDPALADLGSLLDAADREAIRRARRGAR